MPKYMYEHVLLEMFVKALQKFVANAFHIFIGVKLNDPPVDSNRVAGFHLFLYSYLETTVGSRCKDSGLFYLSRMAQPGNRYRHISMFLYCFGVCFV